MNSGYRSYGREDSGNSKRFQSRGPREYNPSPDDMLNGPCHIHSTFVDGKRLQNIPEATGGGSQQTC
jgi:hypothetical protein